ncbi:type II toxin-antitoxin system RelE/ParE family toxin [Desulfobacterales bacterium HSG2]|nr:type II toxin-antitoxin system RelE/ParE family toxin [Desulfobacterales bacterium HSG2]
MTKDTSYSIKRIASGATKYLRRLSRKQQEAIAQAFDHLCISPFRHPNPTVIKSLKGNYKGLWRYRIGNIRIIYAVDEKERTIQVTSIDTRGDVY